MANPRTRRIVWSGLFASLAAGIVESVFLVAAESGLSGVGPNALGAIQAVGWTIAALAPVVLTASLAERGVRGAIERLAEALRDPRADCRIAAWTTAVGGGLLLYAVVIYFIAERIVGRAQARGSALGLLALAATAALVVIAAAAVVSARALARATVARVAARRRRVSASILVVSALGAIGVALVGLWISSSLEIGEGLDLLTIVVPAVFVTAWAALFRAWSASTRFRSLAGSRALAWIAAALVVVLPATAMFTRGVRADTDSALVKSTLLPKLAIAALHSSRPTDLPESFALAEADSPREPNDATRGVASPGTQVAPVPAPTAAHAGPKPRPNIVLITIDTLRPDHLGAYGYSRPTSPAIDRLAGESVVFERAYAAAPNTPRSLPSLLTSLYPSQIPWRVRANYPALPKGVRTFAEDLADVGYRSHAILTHWYFNRERALHRGFAVWDTSLVNDEIETGREESAPRVTQIARRFLERARGAKEPFLVWVHYFEPHHFYVIHKGTPTFGVAMMDKYDHEILFVDREVGRLLGAIDELKLRESTVVVLTSDHGEAFGEHGKHWHGHALYDEQIRVPLMIRAPSIAAKRTATPVSLVDIRPTLADLAGARLGGRASGKSLVPVLRGMDLPDRALFAEILPQPNNNSHQRMVVKERWKLLEDVKFATTELFDLVADSREKKNVAVSNAATISALRSFRPHLNGAHP